MVSADRGWDHIQPLLTQRSFVERAGGALGAALVIGAHSEDAAVHVAGRVHG